MRLGDSDKLRKEIHLEYSDDLGMLDVIDRKPTVNEWILCSERLPEETGYYIATIKSKDIHETKVRPILYDNYGFGTSIDQEVIAWQPLPEPYKGE